MPVLKSIAACLTALILLTAAPASGAEIPGTPTEAAMNFVGGFSDDHLSGMLSRIGARQPTMVAVSQVSGDLLAVVFDAEIDKGVAIYGPEWQKNMARAWTPLMSDEELVSLATAGAQSPHIDKYLELRGQAGQTMQELSGELFQQILAEVIENTISQLTPTEQN